MKKLIKILDDYKLLIGLSAIGGIFYFDASWLVFGFLFFSILGFGCFVVSYSYLENIIKNNKETKVYVGILTLLFYLIVGCYCFYLSYTAIEELLNF